MGNDENVLLSFKFLKENWQFSEHVNHGASEGEKGFEYVTTGLQQQQH